MTDNNKVWAFFDSNDESGADSLKFMHKDYQKVISFIGEYALETHVETASFFEMREIEIGERL